jgi:CheY-like chemotaxis protein
MRPPGAERGVAKLSELKILVVENNAHMRAILVTVLRAFGAQRILEADGPLGGFSLIATEDIDLVLLDFFLGDHDGYDIVELLRGERPCPNHDVPIIIVTAAPRHPRVLAAVEIGADAVLGKPVTPLEIYEVIDRVMEARAAGDAPAEAAPAA